jgi:hypothetical protein
MLVIIIKVAGAWVHIFASDGAGGMTTITLIGFDSLQAAGLTMSDRYQG